MVTRVFVPLYSVILIDELEKDKEWFDWLVWPSVDCLIINTWLHKK